MLTVFPDNATRGAPSLHGTYLLLSGETGEPLAAIDARALTLWRTACASALAARYLAREDASHLLMVGAGALAPHLIRAHRSVRPITRVTVWNRTHGRAVQLAFGLNVSGIETEVADDLETAVREADIISCATMSDKPLIQGEWLKKGAHLDLVGGFTPKMREADDAADQARPRLCRHPCGRHQGGRRHRAAAAPQGDRRKEDIQGDLFDLCRGTKKGRRRATEVTLFKSVGTAIEDWPRRCWCGGGSLETQVSARQCE